MELKRAGHDSAAITAIVITELLHRLDTLAAAQLASAHVAFAQTRLAAGDAMSREELDGLADELEAAETDG